MLVPILTYAQKKDAPELKVKFGKISEEEIAMKNYEKDPDAAAVILFDIGSLSYDYNEQHYFVSSFERHIRIKIFKREAFDLANFRVVYNSGAGATQRVAEIKGVCYNSNNGKLSESKLSDENIVDESLTKSISVKKMTIPSVQEGSIIELKYKISTNGIFAINGWHFQDKIPVKWSEYDIEIPEFYDYLPVTQGNTPYLWNSKEDGTQGKTVTFSGDLERNRAVSNIVRGSARANWKTTKYHWIQKDVPAFKTEKYMTSSNDYVTKVTFQLKGIYIPQLRQSMTVGNNTTKAEMTAGPYFPFRNSWDKLGEDLLESENFGNAIDKKSATKEDVAKAIAGKNAPKEKLSAIYDYIGKNFEKNDKESLQLSQSFNDLLKNKKGSASDLNILLCNMLRGAGLDASPVVISTRDNGRINRFYPLLDYLDKTLVYVKLSDRDSIVIDMSGYPQPMGLLPFEDLNGEGFVIEDKKTIGWVMVKNTLTTKRFSAGNFVLNTEGVLNGDINYTFTGYEAFDNRKAIKENTAEKHIQSIVKNIIANGKLESHKFENTEPNSDLALKATVKVISSACATKANDKIYINALSCMSDKSNPFKVDERLYDIDFGEPRDEFYQVNIVLPEGYKVEEMPKTARIQLPEGALKFEYLISLKENTITINTKFNIKRTIFQAEEYKDLKQVYAQILTKMGEQIVLTKITK